MGEFFGDRVPASGGTTDTPDVPPLVEEFLERTGPVPRQEAPRQPDVVRSEQQDAQVLLARDHRQQGETALEASIRGLRLTQRGAQPLAFPYRPEFTVGADTTPLGLAFRVLGPNSTREQREFYARELMKDNDIEGDIDDAEIERGTVISLPGQRADGGIVTRDDSNGVTITRWQNGSERHEFDDGDGFSISVTADSTTTHRWSPNSREGNGRIVSTETLQTETIADGTELQRRRNGDNDDGSPRWNLTRVRRDGRTF
ncbi:MAG: hypothetical protein K2Z81_21535, partial [Cyanobacteria bacterium]|nr:hypothetical protein [Cyanobacteriota bacterium]